MWHQASRDKPNTEKDKKMKGLAITILLAVLEISAMASGRGDLLTDDLQPVPAIRKEEAGIQSEVLVDAERPEVASLEPAALAADVI
jgi:hypothetical protein